MSWDVPGVTLCPACLGELETCGADGDPPSQRVMLECAACELSVCACLIRYPDQHFVTLGLAVTTVSDAPRYACDDCGDDAVIVAVHSDGYPPVGFCRQHVRRLYEEVIDEWTYWLEDDVELCLESTRPHAKRN